MTVEIGKLQKLTSPNPFALITTTKPDGGTNVMALSWWTYVSNKPPMVVIALSKKGYSGGLIKESGEFGLNLVGESLAKAALACGRCSGRTIDKAKDFGIELRSAKSIKTAVIKDAVAAMECRLVSTAEASDHDLFIAEIIEAVISHPENGHLYAMDGYASLKSL